LKCAAKYNCELSKGMTTNISTAYLLSGKGIVHNV
jgi:hypothetical protein